MYTKILALVSPRILINTLGPISPPVVTVMGDKLLTPQPRTIAPLVMDPRALGLGLLGLAMGV